MLFKNTIVKITYNLAVSCTENGYLGSHQFFLSVDFKCKYRFNFSFKNHIFFGQPFLFTSQTRKYANVFRKYACLLFKCAWKEIKAWQKKSR